MVRVFRIVNNCTGKCLIGTTQKENLKDEDVITTVDIREYNGKELKILERRNVEEQVDMAELKKLEDGE